MLKKITGGLLLGLLLSAGVSADEDLPVMSASDQEEVLEPEVTIRQQGSRTIHEYRMNGRLYMVKIVPRNGPAYYLVDQDGDGEMDVAEDDPARIVLPQWVLFRW